MRGGVQYNMVVTSNVERTENMLVVHWAGTKIKIINTKEVLL